MTFKSDFLRILDERGFIHQGTNLEGLDARLMAGVVTGYIGFDATARSLHAGSLIQIMLLHWFQETGHRP
ncbi:MAG TPA: tyrosine--tRNA ligase, partial [Parvularcula sp.]|nr:tyrosine--tRNA ligase [Parvularcula sp.]